MKPEKKQLKISADGEIENGLFCNSCHHLNEADVDVCAQCGGVLERDFSPTRWTLQRISKANRHPTNNHAVSAPIITTLPQKNTLDLTTDQRHTFKKEQLSRIHEIGRRREGRIRSYEKVGSFMKRELILVCIMLGVFSLLTLFIVYVFH
jgi:hypothetical protein